MQDVLRQSSPLCGLELASWWKPFCVGAGEGVEEGQRVVWVLFHDGHFQIVCPSQRMRPLRMPDIPGHFIVVPHGELMWCTRMTAMLGGCPRCTCSADKAGSVCYADANAADGVGCVETPALAFGGSNGVEPRVTNGGRGRCPVAVAQPPHTPCASEPSHTGAFMRRIRRVLRCRWVGKFLSGEMR